MFGLSAGLSGLVTAFVRRRERLADRVARARRTGVGTYMGEWHAAEHTAEDAPASIAESVLAWCRETVGGTRRPWGIGHFDLALAVACEGGQRRTMSLRGLAPTALYPGDLFVREVHDLLVEDGALSHVAVALFSWGDATHYALGDA